MKTVESRILAHALLIFPLCAFGALLLSLASCRKEEPDFGVGQRAQKKETELRNQTLLEQFVMASEELEKYPNPAYLENALSRLNPWLESCAASRDFRPSEEYQALGEEFRLLGETAEEVHALCAKTQSGMSQGQVAPNDAEGGSAEGLSEAPGLTDDEAGVLAEKLNLFQTQIAALNARYRSSLLARFERMGADLNSRITEASTFRFGGPGKMVSSAVARFPFTPLMNFRVLSHGAIALARLYRLDSRAFSPEDTSHFKCSVWERNVVAWAKGNTTSTTEQVMNLFRWTCDVVALRGETADAIESLPRQAWQTLLTSQGNGVERSIVFMGLLRQIGLTSFVVKPTDPAKEEGFPLLVGVVVPGEGDPAILLFLPEYGFPVPGGDGPVNETDPDKGCGLRFPTIATLDEGARDDTVWRRLDLDDQPFPLSASDLESVRAVVPTDMFNMSERMWIMMRESVVEGSGSDAASFVPPILALSFESVKNEIGHLPHIAGVEHGWEFQTPIIEQTILPIESQILLLPYTYAVEASNDLSMRADDGSSKKYAPSEGAGSDTGDIVSSEAKRVYPLWEGKILYFKGRFDTENGAANRLQQGRIPDRLLKQASLELGAHLNEYIQQVQDAEGHTLTEEQTRAMAAQFLERGRQEIGMKLYQKVTARFYLGLVAHAMKNDEAAITHFEDADLINKLDGLWKSGTLNMLAGIYESRGEFGRAEKIYGHLEGAAAPGGKIRARWLRDREEDKP